MKAQTIEMLVKGVAGVGAAVCLQLASSLGQWANSGEWPSRINWVLIVTLAAGAGFNALWTFMSSAYGNWRAGGSSTSPVDTTTKPATTTP